MGDDERELNPRAPSEGLNLAAFVVGDALLDGGEVGEVDARAEHAGRHLDQLRALELGGGGGGGLEGHRGELPRGGEEGGDDVVVAVADAGVLHGGAGGESGGEGGGVSGSAVLHEDSKDDNQAVDKH